MKDKKLKIAIVLNILICGGVEKALLNFLSAIDVAKYDVTLFILNDKQEYYSELKKIVNVEFTECNAKESLKNDLKCLKFLSVFKSLFFRFKGRLSKDRYEETVLSYRCYSKIDKKFDCAIAYRLNYPDIATVVWRINADKKFAVIHSAVGPIESLKWRRDFEKIDHFFTVSEFAKTNFCDFCPELSNKVTVLHNILNYSQIIEMAKESLDLTMNKISLCTVGRLSPEKGQTLIPKTARMLKDAGYGIHWYLVGDGPDREVLEKLICEHGVGDSVFLLGTKSNPYPYMKQCDIYVQTSFSEGYCLTTAEASVLCRPVVTTNLPVMKEQFVSGENGLIVEEMTSEALFDGIRYLIDNPDIRQKFVDSLKNKTWDNAEELKKLYAFFDS